MPLTRKSLPCVAAVLAVGDASAGTSLPKQPQLQSLLDGQHDPSVTSPMATETADGVC
jgi:hypothetical protein